MSLGLRTQRRLSCYEKNCGWPDLPPRAQLHIDHALQDALFAAARNPIHLGGPPEPVEHHRNPLMQRRQDDRFDRIDMRCDVHQLQARRRYSHYAECLWRVVKVIDEPTESSLLPAGKRQKLDQRSLLLQNRSETARQFTLSDTIWPLKNVELSDVTH